MVGIAPPVRDEEEKVLERASIDGAVPAGDSKNSAGFGASDLRAVACVATLAAVATTILVFGRAPYYIEPADQSLYLLMIDDPRAAIRSASGFHVLLAPLFTLVGDSVVGFRMLRAVLDIGVDVGLGVSLVRYLRWRSQSSLFTSTAASVAVVSTTTLAGFSVWTFAVNGFGYDQLGGIIFTLWASLVLWLVGQKLSPRRTAAIAVAIGFVLGLGAIVRWTAALAVGLLLAWILIERFGTFRALRLAGYVGAGVAGAWLFVHIAVFDLGTLIGGIVSGTSDVGRDTHSLPVLIDQYVVSLTVGVNRSIGIALAAALSFLALSNRERVPFAMPIVLVGSGLLVFGIHAVFGFETFLIGNSIGAVLGLTGVAVWLVYAHQTYRTNEPLGPRRNVALIATFVSLPVLLAAGSFIPIFLTALPLALLWVAGFWIAVPELTLPRLSAGVAIIGLVIVSSMPLAVWQGFQTPARTLATESPVEVERGRFQGLLVDTGTQQLLHDLEDLRLQLDPNPTVLSFWSRPIVPFALEGTGIGFPWYTLSAPNATAETLSGACLDDGDSPTGDVVIVTEETDPREFGVIRNGLLDCGIDFPVDFDLVQTMRSPFGEELSVFVREGEN